MTDKRCAERIDEELASRIEDIELLWAGYTNAKCPRCDGEGNIGGEVNGSPETCPICKGEGKLEEDIPDLGNLNDYGLGFDYVAPNTFGDQKEPYFRWQISWGGPSDEFRFYASKTRDGWEAYRIEYAFMDWFDGATKTLHGDNLKLLNSIFRGFFDCCTNSEYEKAMKDYEPEQDEEEDEE